MPTKTKVDPIPEGFHTVTPYLIVNNATKALDFYKKAFGAKVLVKCACPDTSKIVHSELKIGDSMLMLADEWSGPDGHGLGSPKSLKGTCALIHLYVKNTDTAFKKAVKAGCKVIRPVADMFWGDRFGEVIDPFGHRWAFSTCKEQLSKKEIAKRAMECCPSSTKKKKK